MRRMLVRWLLVGLGFACFGATDVSAVIPGSQIKLLAPIETGDDFVRFAVRSETFFRQGKKSDSQYLLQCKDLETKQIYVQRFAANAMKYSSLAVSLELNELPSQSTYDCFVAIARKNTNQFLFRTLDYTVYTSARAAEVAEASGIEVLSKPVVGVDTVRFMVNPLADETDLRYQMICDDETGRRSVSEYTEKSPSNWLVEARNLRADSNYRCSILLTDGHTVRHQSHTYQIRTGDQDFADRIGLRQPPEVGRDFVVFELDPRDVRPAAEYYLQCRDGQYGDEFRTQYFPASIRPKKTTSPIVLRMSELELDQLYGCFAGTVKNNVLHPLTKKYWLRTDR